MELPLTLSASPPSAPSIHRRRPSHTHARAVNHGQKWEIDAKVLRGAHSRLAAEVV
jgi:hypothetical protein